MAAVLTLPPHRNTAALVLWVVLVVIAGAPRAAEGGYWCVARSDASEEALQRALDYACGGGADCAPLLPTGLCYLPNTVQAHASYAFNSYYQRRGNAPDSCSFAGTSTVARTDPSYGSCVYPASPRSAGVTTSSGGTSTSPPSIGTTPITNEPPPSATNATSLNGGGGGSIPDIESGIPDPSGDNKGSQHLNPQTILLHATLLLIFWFLFKPCWF